MPFTSRTALVVPTLTIALAAHAAAQIQAYTFQGTSAGNQAGASVRNAFDVNNDGFDDIIVGEPFANPNGSNSGRARVYSGKTGAILWTFNGATSGDQFGSAVAGLGDVNGDSFGDVAVSAPQEDFLGVHHTGALHVYSGMTGQILFETFGTQADEQLAVSVSNCGDADGDGHPDVVIGTPFWSGQGYANGGAVTVMSGFTGAPIPADTRFGTEVGGLFGWAVAAAGDIDHDGRDDFIASASFGGPNNAGEVWVLSGVNAAILHDKNGLSSNSQFGYSVSGARDIDHDGWPDFVVGAPYESVNGNASGRVKVFSGHTGNALYTIDGSSGVHLGLSVSAIADVDGDNFDDFLAGAPYADHFGDLEAGYVRVFSGGGYASFVYTFYGSNAGDRMGWSVSRGGDINNDGMADVIGGAPLAAPNGANSGLARVWFMGCPPPLTYCTAKTNSAGCVPQIGRTGVPTRVTGADNFMITASNVLTNKNGIMFWGMQALTTPFLGGVLCVHAPTIRTPIQNSGCPTCAPCQGSYAFAFDHAYMATYSVQAGDTLYAQFWSRDPGFMPPNSVGLTDALQITVCK